MGEEVNFEELANKVGDRGGERLDSSVVINAIGKVQNRFDIPEVAVERAKNAQVWLVSREQFAEYGEMYFNSIGLNLSDEFTSVEIPDEVAAALGVDVNELNRKKAERLELLRNHIKSNQGIAYPLESGGSLILINRDDCQDVDMVVTHEVIHAMVNDYFDDYDTADDREHGGYGQRGLKEAVVQLMTLCSMQPNRSVDEILKEISKDIIKTPFANEINKLGLLMWATTLGKNADYMVDFKQIVELYFDEEVAPVEKLYLLRMKIARGLPEEAVGKANFQEVGLKVFDSI